MIYRPTYYYTLLLITLLMSSCQSELPMVSLGIDETYHIARMQKLLLQPAFTGHQYRWSTADGRLLSTDRDYIFLSDEEGRHNLVLDIIDDETPYHHEFTVNVMHEEIEYSPYISHVYEYRPAPGQFINEMPKYEPGDTEASMAQKAEDCISGKNDIMISLGAYGGYVTFGFDHTVINVPGEKDFRIWGNAFYELLNPEKKGGSCEPGIVWVSYDTNCNGLPDDPWYELAGSHYYNMHTKHNYALTYHAPDPDRKIYSQGPFINDVEYIRWTDSNDSTGYIHRNTFHSQDYYPKWLDEQSYTLSGSCLPRNAYDTSGNGTYYILQSFDWGYVDNHPNDLADLNSFDISWAVDNDGNKVHLPGVDFIRVQTGINQYCGWIGETSTELSKAADLHINTGPIIPPDPLE